MRKWMLSAGIGGLLLAGLLTAADKKEGDAVKGKEVFEQCGVCHNTDTDEKKIGPSLKGALQARQAEERQEGHRRNREGRHQRRRQRNASLRRSAVGSREGQRHRLSENAVASKRTGGWACYIGFRRLLPKSPSSSPA